MKYLNIVFFLFFGVLLLVACQNEDKAPATKTRADANTPNSAIFIRSVHLKSEPKSTSKNATSAFQGERVTLTRDSSEEVVSEKRKLRWVKVVLPDGTRGWVNPAQLVVKGVPAAVIRDAGVYKRPHVLAPSAKSLGEMDFVAIKKVRDDGWAEIVGKPIGAGALVSGWINSENLTTKVSDVSLAVLYARAMETKDPARKKEQLEKIIASKELSSSVFYPTVARKK